jgi:hypothetical protein
MNSRHRTSPSRNAAASSAGPSARIHTIASTTVALGHWRRSSTTVTATVTRRRPATASRGARTRRASGVVAWKRRVRRTAIAATTATVKASRSGRTTSSTAAGSDPVTMNAFSGQALWQLVQGEGSGYWSTTSAVGT